MQTNHTGAAFSANCQFAPPFFNVASRVGATGRQLKTKKACSPKAGEQAINLMREWVRRVHLNLIRRKQSVSDDRATMGSDDHIHCVATITEAECHDFSTKDARAAANQCWACFGTACRNACSDFVAAAGARIFDAPCHGNWWRWLAASWLAAIHGGTAATQKAEATRLCLCWGSERQHGHSHASCD